MSCYLSHIFVCCRYLVSWRDPVHAGVWSPSVSGNQWQWNSGHDSGLSLLHPRARLRWLQRVSTVEGLWSLNQSEGSESDLQAEKIVDEFLQWWLKSLLLFYIIHCPFMFTVKDCKSFISLVCVSLRVRLLCVLNYFVSVVLFCASCFHLPSFLLFPPHLLYSKW